MLPFNEIFSENIRALFTDRSVDFSLNPDQPSLTTEQTAYLSRHFIEPLPSIITIQQIHEDRVLLVDQAIKDVEQADSVMTNVPQIVLTVRTADCLPIFLYDHEKGAIALVHAGWKGSQKEIVVKTVQSMQRRYGCVYEDLKIIFGPAIRSCCYEVGPEFADHFPAEVVQSEDSLYLDLIGVNKRQLLDVGLGLQQIYDCGFCTCCDQQFFSYRREGVKAGRHLSCLMLK